MNKLRFLKVKIKSLSAEAQIIRKEELRSRGDLRNALRAHRVWDVRSESRATLVAYNFLRGKTLQQTEPRALSEPNWQRVETMVKKYGKVGLPELAEWRKNGTKLETERV
jgi:hypothetical protein